MSAVTAEVEPALRVTVTESLWTMPTGIVSVVAPPSISPLKTLTGNAEGERRGRGSDRPEPARRLQLQGYRNRQGIDCVAGQIEDLQRRQAGGEYARPPAG